MPTNYKILGQTAPTAATETIHYTVPSATSTMVKAINITNTSSSSDTFSISFPKEVASPTYVALMDSSTTAASSTDGITWTTRTLPAALTWSCSAYGNQTFVALSGNSGSQNAAYSTDGITWTATSITFMPWYFVIYANGIFFAIANSRTTAASSTDGITWTTRTLPAASSWRGIAYGNGVFVIASDNTTTTAFSSTDGITWTTRTLPAASSWRGIAYGNGVFVAITSSSTTAASSTDGITWTLRTTTVAGSNAIAFGNGVFVTVNSDNKAASSTDGITWTTRTLPNTVWLSVSYSSAGFIATATLTSIAAFSTDGITWTQRTMPASGRWQGSSGGYVFQPGSTTNSNLIALNNTINGNSTLTIKSGYTLDSKSNIRVTSTNGTSTFSTFGAEIS